MLELRHVDKTYDDGFQALKDINLNFEDGKINVLIGPSGCGKTTTMKLLNRLIDYSDGQILIDGNDIKQINPIELRRKMGFVIQNIGLFPHMTIYNNVATVPKMLKWEKQTIHNKVTELLRMVNLDPDTYMHRYPSELSGGQQQRIGVIRALAAEPSTILMDEPFSALDPISREQLQDELIRLQMEIKKTIIFVTHDMDEALKIADQIILMKDGSIVQKGTPKEIMASPANDFVKEFIGEKRLKLMLPELKHFVCRDDLTVTNHETVATAIEKMITHKKEDIPVIKKDGTYAGILNLYHALSNENTSIPELMDQATIPIYDNEETKVVLRNTNDIYGTVPIIAVDNTFIGTLDKNKLFHSLNHEAKQKRGEA